MANRLPVEFLEGGRIAASPGGLVAALRSVIHDGDRWIGWGEAAAEGPLAFGDTTVTLVPVPLGEDEAAGYYDGFANSVLWPLFHGRLRPVEVDRSQWDAYERVNRRFADRAAEVAPPDSTVWVHDYHLLLVPNLLRRRRPDLRIGFFLHIPFPPGPLFATLPWRRELIAGMLGADLVGFQLEDDAENFLAAADRSLGIDADGHVVRRGTHTATVAAFPISVDVEKWEQLGQLAAAKGAALRRELGCAHVLLGIERLDYTKGVAARIRSLGELLDRGEHRAEDVTLVQVAVPSRTDVPAYQEERDDVLAAVAEVNDRHRRADGSGPVHLIEHAFGERQLAAWYRAADVLLVTSFADGMNLVAKEFVAARSDQDGVLVLSEFAGAVQELGVGALIVNPYDTTSVEMALSEALRLTKDERAARMAAMRRVLRRHDVHRWAASFLARLQPGDGRRLRSVG